MPAFQRTVALCLLGLGTISLGLAQDSKPITNGDVIAMFKAGLAESTIVLAIQHGPTKCDTSPAALIDLKREGVSQAILDAMLKAQSNTRTADGISGRYVGRENSANILDLRPDGTYSLAEN